MRGWCVSPGRRARAPPPTWAGPHLSLSSLRWSMLRGFLRSARTFFFISRAVCFLPLFWSAWGDTGGARRAGAGPRQGAQPVPALTLAR